MHISPACLPAKRITTLQDKSLHDSLLLPLYGCDRSTEAKIWPIRCMGGFMNSTNPENGRAQRIRVECGFARSGEISPQPAQQNGGAIGTMT